ncbi:tumor necrosis factor alpha-induced protein 3-like [Arapaima gigas]
MEEDQCPLGSLGDSKRELAGSIQDLVKKDIVSPRSLGPMVFHLTSLHRYSLPLRSNLAPLLDVPLQKALEGSGSLNWCATEAPLYALRSTERDNSLLDAVAMSMWGVPDKDLVLSIALYKTAARGSPADLHLEGNHEWSAGRQSQPSGEAWGQVVRFLEPGMRQQPPRINPYLHVHLFLLSNVIRRPIVVLGGRAEHTKAMDAVGDSNRGPVGVYLPTLWDSTDCHPYPVVLGSVSPWQRFAPLVTGSSYRDTEAGLPLACHPPEEVPKKLPLRFPPDSDEKHWLKTYLQITDSHLGKHTVQIARLNTLFLPEHLRLNQLCDQVCSQGRDSLLSTCTELKHPPPSPSSSRTILATPETSMTTHCHSSRSESTWPECNRCTALQPLSTNCTFGRLSRCMLGADHPDQRGCLSVENNISGTSSRPQQPTGPSSAPSNLLQHSITHNPEGPHSALWTNFRQKPPTGVKQALRGSTGMEMNDFLCGRCVSCKLETRTFNGLCFQCLQSHTEPPTDTHMALVTPVSLVLPGMRGPPVGVLSMERCRTPQCIYFGTPQHSGYCSLCYCSKDAAQAAPPPSSWSLQLSSTLRDLPRCTTPGCHMLGTPLFHGLCERCHLSSL